MTVNASLQPVVAGVYIPTPTPDLVIGGGEPAASLETTVFLTDERGIVIPNSTNLQGTGLIAADDVPSLTITNGAVGALTVGSFGTAGKVYVPLNAMASSITAAPAALVGSYAQAAANTLTIAAAANAPNYTDVFGHLFVNTLNPTAPYSVSLIGGLTVGAGLPGQIQTNANGVGNPLNLACTDQGQADTLLVKLTTATPGANGGPAAPVAGYTLNPGTNYPAVGPTTLTTGIATVNCAPSFSVKIN